MESKRKAGPVKKKYWVWEKGEERKRKWKLYKGRVKKKKSRKRNKGSDEK